MGSSANYIWTYNAVGAGTLTLSSTASGLDQNSLAAVNSPMAQSSLITINLAGALKIDSIVLTPSNAGTGDLVTAVVAVENTGGSTVTNVQPVGVTEAVGTLAALNSGPVPASVASLVSGGIQNFTFSFFANSTPSLSFSGYATGVDSVSLKGVTATPGLSNPITVFAQGNLQIKQISFTPASTLSVGQLFTVAVTVSDSGQGDALTITGAALQPFGTAAASLSWTTAAQMVSLTAGNTTVFTYVYTATSAGSLGYSALANGLNQNLNPIASQLTGSSLLTIQAPANLALAWSLPVQASIGELLTAVLTVTNVGTAQANNVTTVAMPFVNGTGALGLQTAPSLGIINLASGAAQSFTYTFSPTAVGSVVLTAQADGLDVNTGLNVTSTVASSNSMGIQLATSLTASITAQPLSAKVGDFITVVMTVNNEAGAATASNVVPQGIAASVPASATLLTGPVPALVPALAGGALASFTWTYSAANLAATLNFTASAGAADGNSAYAVSAVAATSNNSQIVSNQPTLTALWSAPSP